MNKTINYMVMLGLAVVLCACEMDTGRTEAAPAAAQEAQAPQKQQAPKPDLSLAAQFDFDGYVVGQPFENKGYQGHELQQYGQAGEGQAGYAAEIGLGGRLFGIFTLQDGTIVSIRKDYFTELGTLVSNVSEKYNIPLKRDGMDYIGQKGDLVVMISPGEIGHQVRYIPELDDYGGIIKLVVYSETLNEQLEAEEEAAQARQRKARADAFQL